MFYDFLLYIFLYFCVVNTAIFFHFKFFIFQCSVRGQAKGRLCRAGVGGEGGSLAISDQRSGSRSRRGWVSENQIPVSSPARLTAVAMSIATGPFKFREMSVSISTRSFVFSIHSFEQHTSKPVYVVVDNSYTVNLICIHNCVQKYTSVYCQLLPDLFACMFRVLP